MKKKIAMFLAVVLAAGAFSGCGTKKVNNDDGKIHISVSDFPTNSNPEAQKIEQEKIDKFMEMYPDIVVEGDTYAYSVDTFLPMVNSGTIPTLYRTWFTEIDKVIDSGYAADITKQATEYGYDTMFEDNIMDMMKRGDKIYGIPNKVYTMGLTINRKLFEDAGLLDGEGLPIVPQTWAELRETAKTIKDKTGKAGFVAPTTNNYGGWCFMNMAWSYGVKFMEERDGKLYATYNGPEMIEALQLLYDMKWTDNSMPENAFVSNANSQELIGTGNGAMTVSAGVKAALVATYNMSKDDIAYDVTPAGPAGRYSLLGGEVWFVKPGASEEEIDACMKWLEFTGVTDTITPEYEEQLKDSLEYNKENGYVVVSRGVEYPLYKTEGERQKKLDEIYSEYENVNPKLFNSQRDDLIVRAEEKYNTQELYKAIDAIIQEVLTNKDVDIAAVVAQSEKDFQYNYFDNSDSAN